GQDIAVGVAQVGDLDIVEAAEPVEQAVTTAVQAHDGEDNLFVRLGGSAGSDGCGQASGGSGVQEVAAGGGGHGVSPVGFGRGSAAKKRVQFSLGEGEVTRRASVADDLAGDEAGYGGECTEMIRPLDAVTVDLRVAAGGTGQPLHRLEVPLG